jgi:hypothetical protein
LRLDTRLPSASIPRWYAEEGASISINRLQGDGKQRPLVPRSRCLPRLKRSVDMTSDVKGWEQLFYVCILIFPFCLSEEAEPVRHDG